MTLCPKSAECKSIYINIDSHSALLTVFLSKFRRFIVKYLHISSKSINFEPRKSGHL